MPSQYRFFKGRVALYALLRAFGVGRGHRVLLPGYTCVVVPSAVRYLGSIPEYTDIDVDSYNSLLHHYVSAFQRLERGGTAQSLKAIIIQHTYGNPNRDTARIVAWARAKGLVVIEDCAHCCGSKIDGQPVGTLGDGAFFSFQWSKPVTTGLGGMAVANNRDCEKALAALHRSAFYPSFQVRAQLVAQLLWYRYLLGPWAYWFALNTYRRLSDLGVCVGSSTSSELDGEMPTDYFQRMGRLQERLLNRQLLDTSGIVAHRIRLAIAYDNLLEENGLQPFRRQPGAVLVRYPVLVRDRDTCLMKARARRVELGDWFNHPLHPAGSNTSALNWSDKSCPIAVSLAKCVVTLPLYSRTSERDALTSVRFLASWCKEGDQVDAPLNDGNSSTEEGTAAATVK
jgi:dTDP-4-amino-4,6-dideoxygalactose transaminase